MFNEAIETTSNDCFLNEMVDEIISETRLTDFKALFAQAARESCFDKNVSQNLLEQIQGAFRQTIRYVNQMIYHSNRFAQEEQKIIGLWMQREFMATTLLGTWPSRSFRKPQNIPGDHHTICQIYREGNQERRGMGAVVNYCFLQEPCCKAVNNRKQYIKEHMIEMIHNHEGETLNVASIACGPAEELFDVFNEIENKERLNALGIDNDLRACVYVDDRVKKERLKGYLKTSPTDVKSLDKHFPERKNDLVYSMGLIDYFRDHMAIRVINSMYDILKPGGEIVIGNFHESCESRVLLDYILNWKLIYRTESDMKKLFANSKFGLSPIKVLFEKEGINMLVHCKK